LFGFTESHCQIKYVCVLEDVLTKIECAAQGNSVKLSIPPSLQFICKVTTFAFQNHWLCYVSFHMNIIPS